MTLIELDDKEKGLFLGWLTQREQFVSEELSLLKSLRQKLDKKPEVKTMHSTEVLPDNEVKTVSAKRDGYSSSWIEIVKNELLHFKHPVPSGEIVKRLLQKAAFQQKGKRFITKAVTSKLWLLQERGEVIKEKENGRFVYSLKNR